MRATSRFTEPSNLMYCDRCDALLTVHRSRGQMRCHHCGYQTRLIEKCSSCGSEDLADVGEGTQRVEQALERFFPNANIVRIDRDSTSRKGELDKKLNMAKSGEADIILGTQLITKGHDFSNLAFVGVLNADQGLYLLSTRFLN